MGCINGTNNGNSDEAAAATTSGIAESKRKGDDTEEKMHASMTSSSGSNADKIEVSIDLSNANAMNLETSIIVFGQTSETNGTFSGSYSYLAYDSTTNELTYKKFSDLTVGKSYELSLNCKSKQLSKYYNNDIFTFPMTAPLGAGRIIIICNDTQSFANSTYPIAITDASGDAYSTPSVTNPSLSGYNTLYDCVEFTFLNGIFNCDITRVDFFSIPMTIGFNNNYIRGIGDYDRENVISSLKDSTKSPQTPTTKTGANGGGGDDDDDDSDDIDDDADAADTHDADDADIHDDGGPHGSRGGKHGKQPGKHPRKPNHHKIPKHSDGFIWSNLIVKTNDGKNVLRILNPTQAAVWGDIYYFNNNATQYKNFRPLSTFWDDLINDVWDENPAQSYKYRINYSDSDKYTGTLVLDKDNGNYLNFSNGTNTFKLFKPLSTKDEISVSRKIWGCTAFLPTDDKVATTFSAAMVRGVVATSNDNGNLTIDFNEGIKNVSKYFINDKYHSNYYAYWLHYYSMASIPDNNNPKQSNPCYAFAYDDNQVFDATFPIQSPDISLNLNTSKVSNNVFNIKISKFTINKKKDSKK